MEFETVERCGRIHVIKNGVESAGFIERDRGGRRWGCWDFVLVTVGLADEGLAHIAAAMDDWHTVLQAAVRLVELGKVTKPPATQTMYRWLQDGRFQGAIKVRRGPGRGGTWRLSESSLREFERGGGGDDR